VLFAFGSFLIWREGNWAKPDFSILRPLLKYGLPLVPGAFAVWALNYVDRIFIVQMLTLQQAGIYSLAYSIANQISPLLVRPWRVMFANSAAELYSQKDTSTLQRLFERSAGLTFILSLPASVGLFLLGHRLFALFATEEFSQGVPALLFVSLGYIFLMLSSYYEIALGLVFKQYLSTWFYLIALIVNVLLNLILIPRFTITGAAFATMIAFFAILALSMYYSSKYNLLHTNFVFVAKVGVATAGMAIAVQLLNGVVGRLGQPILELLLLAFLGCLVFAGLLWVFGVLTKREFDLALSIVRK
jgi:O-antigen/teichoic acid export membrane protein